jgi:hypothetical protein
MVEAVLLYWSFVQYEARTIYLRANSLTRHFCQSSPRQKVRICTARFLYKTSIILSTITESTLATHEMC